MTEENHKISALQPYWSFASNPFYYIVLELSLQ